MEGILKEIDKLSDEDKTKVLFYILAKNHIRLKKEDVNIRVYYGINDMSVLKTSSLKNGKIE